MPNKTDISWKFVAPKPHQPAGWNDELHLITDEQMSPVSHHGNVNEIVGKFDSAGQLRNFVNQPQSLQYAA